jgi:predicted alpha/beta-fold hydrolase
LPAPFRPFLKNPHLLTILGNFVHRHLDMERYPAQEQCLETEPGVRILVHAHEPPDRRPVAHLVTVHGLEGSSNAGYIRSLTQLALENGFAVHRTNMRSCGGTDEDCRTMYHAGLTSDTLHVVRELRRRSDAPIFLAGFSLGGNVALKLAAELGDDGPKLLRGVVGVSVPVDLAACVRTLRKPGNRIYEMRFLRALKARIRRRAAIAPDVYDASKLDRIASVYDFDDAFVAPFFGFGTADNYYATQSSLQYFPQIRVPTLIVQAKDDPMIPFDLFQDARLTANPKIRLIATEHGGHLGYIAAAKPHFWLDRCLLEFMNELRESDV